MMMELSALDGNRDTCENGVLVDNDFDNDEDCDNVDNCFDVYNPNQTDSDGDLGNSGDICPKDSTNDTTYTK